MRDILRLTSQEQIPELNIYQCGTASMHSLYNAQAIAQNMLDRGIGIMDTKSLLLKDFS